MGKWGTHDVNLSQSNVQSMKEKGCRFCYISDNQKNIDKFNKKMGENTDKSKDENTDKSKDENTDNIFEFITDNGDKITGLIVHLVMGHTYGCKETSWFLVEPKTRKNEVIIEDL
jgi:hypothetical protein